PVGGGARYAHHRRRRRAWALRVVLAWFVGAQGHAQGCHRQARCRGRRGFGRSGRAAALCRDRSGGLAARQADAGGARRTAAGRDREVVADHQGSRHQGGVSRPGVSTLRPEVVMKLPRRKFLHLVLGAAALPTIWRVAWAQSYPTRPVRIVVPLPAGGAAHLVARLIAPLLAWLCAPGVLEDN